MKTHFTRKDTVNTQDKLLRTILRAFVLSFLGYMKNLCLEVIPM